MTMRNKVSALLLGTALAFSAGSAAFAQDKTVKIGSLSDQSGSMPILAVPVRHWRPRWQ